MIHWLSKQLQRDIQNRFEKWSYFVKVSNIFQTLKLFSQKVPTKTFDMALNTPLNETFLKFLAKERRKYHYHLASKLSNPSTSVKTYWPILKTFYNGKKSTTYSFTSSWHTIFNKFLASQCVLLNKDSKILYCQRFMTNAIISSIKFEDKALMNVRQMYMMIYM